MKPKLNLQDFFDNCNPSKTLVFNNLFDRRYYIDFSVVRGAKVIEKLERTITRLSPHKATCQLFTGHIGCGKSTVLRRLEGELKRQGFHVVYESTQDLDMADVDVTDVMLAITRQVSDNLENFGIKLRPGYLGKLLNEILDFLQRPIELKPEVEISLPLKIAKITAKTKDSPKLRSRLRQYLEPQTNNILQWINIATDELIEFLQEQIERVFNGILATGADLFSSTTPTTDIAKSGEIESGLRELQSHSYHQPELEDFIPLIIEGDNMPVE